MRICRKTSKSEHWQTIAVLSTSQLVLVVLFSWTSSFLAGRYVSIHTPWLIPKFFSGQNREKNPKQKACPIKPFEQDNHTSTLTYLSQNQNEKMQKINLEYAEVQNDNVVYYEALVHPAMITAEDSPEKVVILAANKDGGHAILREVFKYKSVQEIVMVGINLAINNQEVDTSAFTNEIMRDCVNFVLDEHLCNDDDCIDIVFEDASKWMHDKYAEIEDGTTVDTYSVIIVDDLTYSTAENDDDWENDIYMFTSALYDMLYEEGVAVIQLGSSPTVSMPGTLSRHEQYEFQEYLLNSLHEIGFERLYVYDEINALKGSQSFVIACISQYCDMGNAMTSAEVEVRIHDRIRRNMCDNNPLKYFDGSVYMEYNRPGKVWERNFCVQEDNKEECLLLKSFQMGTHIPPNDLVVKTSSTTGFSGRGLFTKVNIPKGSVIGQGHAGHEVNALAHSVDIIEHIIERYDDTSGIIHLMNYIIGYGVELEEGGVSVEVSPLLFTNHGCRGSYNVGFDVYGAVYNNNTATFSLHEDNFKRDHFIEDDEEEGYYNPLYYRLKEQWKQNLELSLRDIRAGEELYGNYADYIDPYNEANFIEDLTDIKEMCGGGVGFVSSLEDI